MFADDKPSLVVVEKPWLLKARLEAVAEFYGVSEIWLLENYTPRMIEDAWRSMVEEQPGFHIDCDCCRD